jgi:hypothetical protein
MLTLPTLVAALAVLAQPPLDDATPVPFTAVRLTGGFWEARQRTNADATLDQNLTQCEKTGRLENLARAGRHETGGYAGYFFNDSDVYKAVEGAADILALRTIRGEKNSQLVADRLDPIIRTIAAAQHPDGYLNSYFTVAKPGERWTNLKDMHELYCAGHLIEAGVAHHRATGSRDLLDVAIRLADHIDARFGPAPRTPGVCGHPEIELALLALWRETGEKRYLDLARYFLHERGRGEGRPRYGEYCQDHKPLERQDAVVGHAVRAMYLYSAATELAVIDRDAALADALDRLWDNLTLRKMYVTGGIGNSASNEGFTRDYDLPNDAAYAETCAGIGLIFWAHRMNLMRGEAVYADVLERALYNAALSGVSLDGRSFFYVNPVSSRGGITRQPWYSCACCPPNILRLIAGVGGYVYVQDAQGVRVNLYAAGRADFERNGAPVSLVQETNYPWDGRVTIVVETPPPGEMTLKCRIPGWAERVTVKVNGRAVDAGEPPRGYVPLRREWKAGDRVELEFPMTPRRVVCSPHVPGNVGRVAIQRGPIVYCAEGADNPDGLQDVFIPPDAAIREAPAPSGLAGAVVLEVEGRRRDSAFPADALYAPVTAATPCTIRLIPYFMWGNRGPGEMAVWIPDSAATGQRTGRTWLRPSASHVYGGDRIEALCDGVVPEKSSDESVPRMTWWPRKGSPEWVRYDFDRARRVDAAAVMWFDDTGHGECAAPASWRLDYLAGDAWKPVVLAEGESYGTRLDTLNRVRFLPVETTALRLTAALREGRSAGVLEWDVSAK